MKCIALSEGVHGGTRMVYGEPVSDQDETEKKNHICPLGVLRRLLTSGVAVQQKKMVTLWGQQYKSSIREVRQNYSAMSIIQFSRLGFAEFPNTTVQQRVDVHKRFTSPQRLIDAIEVGKWVSIGT